MKPSLKMFWRAQAFIGAVMLALFLLCAREERPALTPARRGAPPARHEPVPASGGAREVPVTPRPTSQVADSQAGKPYVSEDYLSRLSRDEDYECWTLDPRELAWLLANRREVLVRDLVTAPEPEGGLRVRALRDACFGARRGLRVGDVLLDINGQELDSAFDLEDFLEDPAYASSSGWRLRLKRGDDVLTVDFR